jgi:hypothetical protein
MNFREFPLFTKRIADPRIRLFTKHFSNKEVTQMIRMIDQMTAASAAPNSDPSASCCPQVEGSGTG